MSGYVGASSSGSMIGRSSFSGLLTLVEDRQHPHRIGFVTEPTVVVAGRELFASFPKTQQHIPVLDLMIGLTDSLQFELS